MPQFETTVRGAKRASGQAKCTFHVFSFESLHRRELPTQLPRNRNVREMLNKSFRILPGELFAIQIQRFGGSNATQECPYWVGIDTLARPKRRLLVSSCMKVAPPSHTASAHTCRSRLVRLNFSSLGE